MGTAGARAAWLVLGVFALASLAPAPALARTAAAVPVSYAVRVTVDIADGAYSGEARVRFTNRTREELDSVVLHLPPNAGARSAAERLLVVRNVTVAGRAVSVRELAEGAALAIDSRLRAGETIEIALELEGRARRYSSSQVDLAAHVTDQVTTVLEPMQERASSGGDLLTAADGVVLLGNPFPVVAGLEGSEWLPSRPWPGAARWLVSASYRCGEAAALVGPEPSPADQVASDCVASFDAVAMRSFALFGAEGYLRRSSKGDGAGLRLHALFKPAHEKAGQKTFETLASAIAVYTELFGPPPVREVFVVEAPLPPGVPAVSFSGVIAIASAYYTDLRGKEGESLPGFLRETPDLMEGALEFAVAQEAARLWWGESVGPDAELAPFVDEALAAYSAVVAFERSRGAEAAMTTIEQQMRAPYRVFRMFGGADEPVALPARRLPNRFARTAILQGKGGLWLAAARAELGDERFFTALRGFHRRSAGRTARAEELVQALTPREKPRRERLEAIHKRWLRGRFADIDVGAPEYVVRAPAGRPGFERFGRFIVRSLARVGKAAAKPF